MARARNIKPAFFKNENLVELPFEFRLMFIGLWTLADREGRLEDRPKRIKMELFPADNIDVDAGLADLERYGFIERYESDGVKVIEIINFSRHQSPHHTEKQSELPDNPGRAPEQQPLNNGESPECNESAFVEIPLNPDSLNPDSLNPEPPIAHEPARGDGGDEPPATERGRLAKELRSRKVNVTPSNPELLSWLEEGATVELVLDAVAEARFTKPEPEKISPRYLTPIVRRLLAGPRPRAGPQPIRQNRQEALEQSNAKAIQEAIELRRRRDEQTVDGEVIHG